jgi:4-hydroxy-3-methylbut-2-enyl diphosphate reductase
VIVVGSRNSSNSNRLLEVAKLRGVRGYLVDGAEQIEAEWLQGVNTIGVTAGASAPETLVQGVISRLQALGAGNVRQLGDGEPEVNFPLPKELLGN